MTNGNRKKQNGRAHNGNGPTPERFGSGLNLGRLRIAVLFVNYGPYHVARARALAHLPQFDPYFIELAAEQKVYPWTADKRDLSDRLITLMNQPYESCSSREVAGNTVRLLDKLQPEAVVIAGYREAPMRAAARWARGNARGVVVFSESTPWDHPRRWWLESIKRSWIRRYVDAAVVGGKPHRDYMVDLGVDPERVWDRYNVVDNEFFGSRCDALRELSPTARIEAGLPQNYFLYVGRFAPEKNLPFLLRCYRRYREIHSDPWGLVIVGDGPQRAELLDIARAEGLNDVVWPGFRQSSELPPYYAFAGCFILPSVLEPWGLVVNEAMASGLPILASRRCGCSADLVVPGRNGFTFDPGDKDELVRLMVDMATRPAQKWQAMSEVSRNVIGGWTPEVWADQVESAVRCAMAIKSGASELVCRG